MKYLALAVLLLAPAVYAQDKTPPKPPAVETQAPTQDWLNQYDEYMALVRVVQQIRQESGLEKIEAKMNEKANSLRTGIPPGYSFDVATKTFKKDPEAPKPEVKK